MIPGEMLLDAYVNANILFLVAYAFWHVARRFMHRFGFGHAYGPQLGLLNAFFLVIALAPLIAVAFNALQNSGFVKGVNVRFADMAVSYYLDGGVAMKAAEFEAWIQLRDTFMLNLLNGSGMMALTFTGAFLIGLAVGFVRLCCSVFCLWRIVANSYDWRRTEHVRIKLSDNILVPFSTRGLRNYYVVIPSQMLGRADELKVSLAHEFQHIRQRDLEWEILLEALKPLFFINPVFHAWKRQVEHLRELRCDSRVMSKGRIDVRTYCETLLSVSRETLRRERALVIAVPKVTLVTADRGTPRHGRKSFLENRIQSVLNTPRMSHQRIIHLAVAIPLVAAVALTSLAIQRTGDWSHDRLMLSTVVNLERIHKINRVTGFGLGVPPV